ncbi:MAG: NAD(P)H-hydrate dehydratase, partial [Simkaniaceae bacterium]|nr:NAD(P)H-hydrate dehydratase [Simkaniaceae bacterium]
HKYEAGYVVALAGSKGMSGAAFLACLAALRTGAGIVRLFHPPGMGGNPPMELICEEWSHESILKEAQRASAFIIGPGLGSFYPVQEVVGQLSAPCVVDGDGLYLLKDIEIFAPHIFTPHVGEMTRLLGTYPTLELCQAYSEEKGATIVLKGAPTFIFHPGCQPVIVTAGDPGMATAGSGDVLTGMIAALLAQGMEGREAAILGVYLHGKAGEEAAKKYTSYSMIASDLIQSVNLVIPSTRGVWGE